MEQEEQENLRVLILEDEPGDAELMEIELRKAGLVFQAQRVDTREAFEQALREFRPDVVLADYKLPRFDGVTALRLVRQHWPQVPVIMVTGALADVEAVDLLHLGARDYVLKDRLARLGPAVRRALGEEHGIRARKAAERAVRESEEKFRTLADSAQDGIVMMDADDAIMFWNAAAERVYGYSEREARGRKLHELIVPERFRASAEQGIARFVLDGTGPMIGQTVELQAMRRDGSEFAAEHSISAVRLQGRWHAIGIVRDISARKRAEEALRRTNRALKTLSVANQALVRGTDEATLLQEMCRAIVETGGYRMAWVGYAAQDAGKIVLPQAAAGAVGLDLLRTLSMTWDDRENGRGPTSRAIRTGQMQVVQDIAGDPGLDHWRALAREHGIVSVISLPLRGGGACFGAVSIYSSEPNAFDEGERRLLAELADDLTFGILTLRAHREHEQLQQEHLKSAERQKESFSDTIRAIALTVEKRDPYTAGHQERVTKLCMAIGRELGLDENRLEGLRLGAAIHDIGKIYVPAEILTRPGRLSDAEFEIIKSHPAVGYDIVKDVKFVWPVAQMILQHHERLDGSGYPRALRGEEAILPEARILAVADVVEAMSSHRPYRPAIGLAAALAEIEAGRGARYCAVSVDACLRLFREQGYVLGDGDTTPA